MRSNRTVKLFNDIMSHIQLSHNWQFSVARGGVPGGVSEDLLVEYGNFLLDKHHIVVVILESE